MRLPVSYLHLNTFCTFRISLLINTLPRVIPILQTAALDLRFSSPAEEALSSGDSLARFRKIDATSPLGAHYLAGRASISGPRPSPGLTQEGRNALYSIKSVGRWPQKSR